MAETETQKLIRRYETAHRKEIASGYKRRCPYCKSEYGPTAIRKKKGDSHRVIRALCYTCYTVHGRRLKAGQIIDTRGEAVTNEAKKVVGDLVKQISKTKARKVSRRKA